MRKLGFFLLAITFAPLSLTAFLYGHTGWGIFAGLIMLGAWQNVSDSTSRNSDRNDESDEDDAPVSRRHESAISTVRSVSYQPQTWGYGDGTVNGNRWAPQGAYAAEATAMSKAEQLSRSGRCDKVRVVIIQDGKMIGVSCSM